MIDRLHIGWIRIWLFWLGLTGAWVRTMNATSTSIHFSLMLLAGIPYLVRYLDNFVSRHISAWHYFLSKCQNPKFD
ncbi:hypothetical protein C2G38_1634695 [Gigaspora rosea]|uniref:Uncharacterized protein n=1 Tax=Gigaspora rosea TaxID=44941 RepID=A0A397UZ96_9GLOM|nr:hypothetical protein C2G38_1634695 [Gigaspora rosea]